MMNYGIIPISHLQLAMSIILVLMAGLVSAFLKLGLLKSLIWGTIRAFIQLSLIGYLLAYIFQINHFILILLIMLLMCYIAAREATRRVNVPTQEPLLVSFLSLTASSLLVSVIVVTLIITPRPWYSAQIWIPIFGMILGNSMNGISLALDRMYNEVRSHTAEIEAFLCFGASPWEAVKNSVRKALRAGMTPTINSLMVVGLVTLPGMMTGQILAGADPREAVRYQFVVMVMITASAALGCLLLIGISYRKMFTEDLALTEDMRQSHN